MGNGGWRRREALRPAVHSITQGRQAMSLPFNRQQAWWKKGRATGRSPAAAPISIAAPFGERACFRFACEAISYFQPPRIRFCLCVTRVVRSCWTLSARELRARVTCCTFLRQLLRFCAARVRLEAFRRCATCCGNSGRAYADGASRKPLSDAPNTPLRQMKCPLFLELHVW